MSKKINIVVIVIMFISSGNVLMAQDLTNPQRRYINLQVYSLLENYTRYGRLSSNYSTIDETYLREFSSLFDPSARVFNDILPYNQMDYRISVDEYLTLAGKYYPSGIGLRLHNIQIDIPSEYSKGKFNINAHLLKEIYGTTAQNANYKDTLSLTFNIEFSIEDSGPAGFRIRDIGGAAVGRTLRLLVVDKKTNDPINSVKVKFDNHTYYTNSSGRIEFKDLDPTEAYSYAIDAKNYASINQPNFYVDEFIKSHVQPNPTAEYFDPNEIVYRLSVPARFFISMHIAPTITENSIRFDEDKLVESDTAYLSYTRTQDFNFGLKFGYRILASKKLELSLLAGLEYTNFSSNLDKYYREYWGVDNDNDSCIFQVSINGNQTTQTSGLTIPAHLLLKYRIFNKLSINLESGINLNFFMNQNYEIDAVGSSFGKYPKYSNQIIENDSILGFVDNITLSGSADQNWSGSNYTTLYISPTISWNLSRSMEIYGGPALIVGFGDLNKNDVPDPQSISDDVIDYMTEVAGKATLRAWSFEIGLRYLFGK